MGARGVLPRERRPGNAPESVSRSGTLAAIRSPEQGSRQRISVVILARNEERTIGRVVREVAAFGDEVLVMDGNSTDRTASEARAAGAAVHADPGLGKGSAVG